LSKEQRDDGREVETPFELIHRLEAYVYKVLEKRFNGNSPEENETVITCSPEAKEVFRKFQNYLDVTTLYLDDIKQFARRGREHAIRLAGFLASIRKEQTITESVAKHAAELVLWHWSEVKDCYDDSVDSPVDAVAERVKEFIADNDGVAASRDLYRSLHIRREDVVELLDGGHLNGYAMWKEGKLVSIGDRVYMPDGAKLISPLPKRKEAS